MNQYEVMYILDAAVEESERAALIERFQNVVTAGGGNVDRVDEWGKRRLEYAINYKTEGYYVLMYITANSDLPKEIERNFQITDSVLRYMVIRYEGALPAKRVFRTFVPREAAPVAAAEAPAAEAPAEAAAEPAAEPAPEAQA